MKYLGTFEKVKVINVTVILHCEGCQWLLCLQIVQQN